MKGIRGVLRWGWVTLKAVVSEDMFPGGRGSGRNPALCLPKGLFYSPGLRITERLKSKPCTVKLVSVLPDHCTLSQATPQDNQALK